MVERTDGDFVKLLADEADVPEVGGTGDLGSMLVFLCSVVATCAVVPCANWCAIVA